MKNNIIRLSAYILILLNIGCQSPTEAKLTSPDGKVYTEIKVSPTGKLLYSVNRGKTKVIKDSSMGIDVNNIKFGENVKELGNRKTGSVSEKYPYRGVKSQVENNYNWLRIKIKQANNKNWFVEARAYDDGIAFRYIIPGKEKHKITGERTTFALPVKSKVWYQTHTRCYEGEHKCTSVEKMPKYNPKNKKPISACMPITIELPDGSVSAITEADIMDYSGMTLSGTGTNVIKGVFDDDRKGWEIKGKVYTPWRVIMTGPNLNSLVNNHIVASVCPAPDKKLFPKGIKEEWIKPGRSLWQWWAYGDRGTQWNLQKKFVDQAADLNCQYYLVDAGWENPKNYYNWTDSKTRDSWPKMKELCDYAKSKGVGIWVWRPWKNHYQGPGLETVEQREEFLKNCKRVGIVGIKIDYMDSESHNMLKFYKSMLELSAKYKIMINFHGSNKPAGEARTWPHEISREGIRGLENNKWGALSPKHYTSLCFTRMLAGHGDFTPTTFQHKYAKNTTFSHQLATAAIFTSPFLCWADKPEVYQKSNALEYIKTMPYVWDETKILKGSKIGELAVFARRNGKDWYVAIINGGNARDYNLNLDFLGKGKFIADTISDIKGKKDMHILRNQPVKNKTINIQLNKGGGYFARFKRVETK